MADLTTQFLHLKLKNPTILASGIMDVSASAMKFAIDNGAGSVVTKSIGFEPRYGHKCPTILTEKNFMINAVGLSNPGAEGSIEEILQYKKMTREPIIASIFGRKVEEYGHVASIVSKAHPDMIEVNISCPNVDDEFGKPFSLACESAAAVTEIVKKNTKIPISVKLSPNVPDIKAIAKAVESAGANAITAVNTYGPGLVINTATKKPILQNKFGGVSGPAIRPLAVKAVYDIFDAVKIPIMGVGGITYGDDAVQMMMAGASSVQMGSAVYYRGIDVFSKVSTEIRVFMQENGYSKVKELVGIAHE